MKKATKMLMKTLKWRSEYKPDEIRWVRFSPFDLIKPIFLERNSKPCTQVVQMILFMPSQRFIACLNDALL